MLTNNVYNTKTFIKQNYMLLIVSLIFILTLLIVLNKQGDYMITCNDHWRNVIKENCNNRMDLCSAVQLYNESFEIDILTNFNQTYDYGGIENG